MNGRIDMSKIEIMEHEQAVRTQAVERYLLGELSEKERDAFEAHYFDCKACYDQVAVGEDFLSNARQVLASEATDTKPAQDHAGVQLARERQTERGWLTAFFGGFRSPAMVFVSAMLLCAIGLGVYQQNLISSLRGPKLEARYTLAGESRGLAKLITANRNAALSLRLDFERKPEFVSYKAQIESEAGKMEASVPIPAVSTDDSVTVSINAGTLKAGRHALVVYGRTAEGKQEVVQEGRFELQFAD